MKLRLLPLLLLAFSPLHAAERVWFGTQSKAPDGGIFTAVLGNDGKLSDPVLAGAANSPGFIALSPCGKFIFAATAEDEFKAHGGGGVASFRVGSKGALNFLSKVATGSTDTCHITVSPDSRHVFVSHYSGGCLTVHPVNPAGQVLPPSQTIKLTGSGPNPKRQTKAYTHAANFDPSGKFLVVNDLGCDRVFVYAWDAASGKLTPANPDSAALPPGSGPRHFAFHPSKPYGYCLNELLITVTTLSWSDGKLVAANTVPAYDPGETRGESWSGAEIRASKNGRFLYASVRTRNHIAVFSLESDPAKPKLVESVPAGVETPRNFNLSPSGRWLLAAGQKSNDVATLAVDPATGRLSATSHRVSLPSPICVVFEGK